MLLLLLSGDDVVTKVWSDRDLHGKKLCNVKVVVSVRLTNTALRFGARRATREPRFKSRRNLAPKIRCDGVNTTPFVIVINFTSKARHQCATDDCLEKCASKRRREKRDLWSKHVHLCVLLASLSLSLMGAREGGRCRRRRRQLLAVVPGGWVQVVCSREFPIHDFFRLLEWTRGWGTGSIPALCRNGWTVMQGWRRSNPSGWFHSMVWARPRVARLEISFARFWCSEIVVVKIMVSLILLELSMWALRQALKYYPNN